MARVQRDEDWTAQWGAPREDIQYARKLIGDGPGWVDRLEAAIGKGLLPALAGAALLGAGAMGQRQQEGQDAQL